MNYRPKVLKDNMIEFLLQGQECNICNKLMVQKANRGVFSLYYMVNQDTQMKKAGLVYKTNVRVDDLEVCLECVDAGKTDFLCAVCNERHTTNEIQETIGDPPEFMCKICYENVPAKEWEEKHLELSKNHQYDFI